MSREIKLRAWDTNQKCFVPSMYWYLDPIGIARWADNNTEAKRLIISEYTGLKDNNGKEVYEGDIIKYKCCSETTKYVVEFGEASFSGEIHFFQGYYLRDIITNEIDSTAHILLSYYDPIEIIGNKFFNPELLEDIK